MLAGSAAATNWDDNYDPFVELPPETSEQAEQTEQRDGTTEAQRFSDVAATDWYYSVVMQLVEAGTIDGFPDGTFRPKNTVTTGQALKMILLAAGYPEPERAASHWARGYLDFAIEQGFVTRFKEITDLDVPISRALVAQIAAKAMGLTRPETVEISFTDTDDDNVLALAAGRHCGRIQGRDVFAVEVADAGGARGDHGAHHKLSCSGDTGQPEQRRHGS